MNRFLVVAALTALLCGDLMAQAPARDMSVDDLVKALTPQPATTRGLRNLKVEPARVDLVVNFDFDSARIKDSSKPQLERLATAMKVAQLQEMRFQVEGHTDAKGTAAYNQMLSAKRAQAVAGFLSQEGIEPGRLVPLGKGFSELLNKEEPNSPENRRVRITAVDQ